MQSNETSKDIPNTEDEGIEALVEIATKTYVRLTEIIYSIEIIYNNIDKLSISIVKQKQLADYCKNILDLFQKNPFYSLNAYDLHIKIKKTIQNLYILNKPLHKIKDIEKSLHGWKSDVESEALMIRDIGNQIFKKNNKRVINKNSAQDVKIAQCHNCSNNQVSKDISKSKINAIIHGIRNWVSLQKNKIAEPKDNSLECRKNLKIQLRDNLPSLNLNKYLNKQCNNLEILLQSKELQSYPVRMTMEPTSFCNYQCTMCPHGDYTSRPSYFEIDDIAVERFRPVFEFANMLAVQVTGEPTWSLQLGKITDIASKYEVNIEMITNGSLLHKTNADLSKFSNICISFDGATKDVFEALRYGSSFERVKRNIKMIRDKYPFVDIELNVCISRLNIGHLADIVRMAVDFGIDRVWFNLMFSRGYPHLVDIELGSEDAELLHKAISEAQSIANGTTVRIFNSATDMTLSKVGGNRKLSTKEMLYLVRKQKNERKLSLDEIVEKVIDFQFSLLPDIFENVMDNEKFQTQINSHKRKTMVDSSNVEECYKNLLMKVKSIKFRNLKLPYCTAPYKGGIILSNGSYFPCCFMHGDLPVSKYLNKVSFDKLWNDSGIQKIRESMFGDRKLLPVCHQCNGRQRYTYIIELLKTAHRIGYKWEEIEFPANFNPPDAIGKEIENIRSTLFSQSYYDLGMPIKFGLKGNALPFMSYGFSSPGDNGAWSDGFESVLTLYINEPVNSDILFEVSVFPFLHSNLLKKQRMELYANDQYIDQWTFTKPGIQSFSITIPVSVISEERLQFVFRLPNATSWKRLNINKNKQNRGIMFVEAKLSQCE